MLLLFAGLLAVVVLVAMVHGGAFGKLPSRDELAAIRNEEATLVLARDGTIIGRLFAEDRTNIRYEDLPQHLIDALVSTEDARFFRHEGVDPFSYLRVLVRTILGGDRRGGGGSTISQQIVKNLYGRSTHGPLTMPVNKIKEAVVAYRLEQVYDKEQVLLLYFNSVPFGENVYGVEAASRRFFGKPASRLQVEEAAVLVGMLKANTGFNPRLHPEASRGRRNTVLALMHEHGHLSASERDSLQDLPLDLHYQGVDALDLYGYFVDRVSGQARDILAELTKPDGSAWDLRKDGLRVHTTLDTELQHLAAEAAREQLKAMQPRLDRQLAARKARRDWERGRKADARWKADVHGPRELVTEDGLRVDSISYRDSLWHYHRMLHAAVYAMEPGSGRVRAWVGGRHHRYLPYDLVRAERPIASTVKPLLYSAALEGGMDPCTYLDNRPRVYPELDDWAPANFDHDTTGGEVALWYALARSMNLPTVDLYFRTGTDTIRDVFEALGMPLDRVGKPAMSLGAVDASLERLVRAYGAFAMRGQVVEPVLIERITTAEGGELFKAPAKSKARRAITEPTAAAVALMLQRAVNEGTGTALRSKHGVRMTVGGKTGTSQDYADAWFVATQPGLVVGTWVGAMDPGVHFQGGDGTGSRLALPVVGSVLRGLERSAELRKRYVRPFDWPEAFDVDMDCDPRRQTSGLEELLEDLFEGKKHGRHGPKPDYTKPEEPLRPKEDKPGLFERLFGKKKRKEG